MTQGSGATRGRTRRAQRILSPVGRFFAPSAKRGESPAFTVADVLATALFSVEGAAVGIHQGLDLLGAVVVGMCTGIGGGLLRDVLMGDLPPAAFLSSSRLVAGLAGSFAATLFAGREGILSDPGVLAMDAAALALFAIAGTDKAIAHGSNALVTLFFGTVTACGGGVVRDILLNRTPLILTSDFYAMAALIGSGCMLVTSRLRAPGAWPMAVGFAVAFGSRIAALGLGWSLPRLGGV